MEREPLMLTSRLLPEKVVAAAAGWGGAETLFNSRMAAETCHWEGSPCFGDLNKSSRSVIRALG